MSDSEKDRKRSKGFQDGVKGKPETPVTRLKYRDKHEMEGYRAGRDKRAEFEAEKKIKGDD